LAPSRSIAPSRTISRIVPRLSASRIGSTPGSRRGETRGSAPGTGRALDFGAGREVNLGAKVAPSTARSEFSAGDWAGIGVWGGVVGGVGVGGGGGGGDLDGRVQDDAGAARDLGQLEAVDVALHEVVAGRHGQLRGQVDALAVGAPAGLPADVHPVGVEEEDL